MGAWRSGWSIWRSPRVQRRGGKEGGWEQRMRWTRKEQAEGEQVRGVVGEWEEGRRGGEGGDGKLDCMAGSCTRYEISAAVNGRAKARASAGHWQDGYSPYHDRKKSRLHVLRVSDESPASVGRAIAQRPMTGLGLSETGECRRLRLIWGPEQEPNKHFRHVTYRSFR